MRFLKYGMLSEENELESEEQNLRGLVHGFLNRFGMGKGSAAIR
jgi:hypothetical protein